MLELMSAGRYIVFHTLILDQSFGWFFSFAYVLMPAFCCFLHFAQRAFCAARILAIAEADILRLFGDEELALIPFAFAHLTLWAVAIRARPAADKVRVTDVVPPDFRRAPSALEILAS